MRDFCLFMIAGELFLAVTFGGPILHSELRSQTAALERIADELKPPLHSETAITRVDPLVCDTLGNALKASTAKGKK